MGKANSADLRPRAIAALVTLRGGITSTGRLCDVLADDQIHHTRELMVDLKAMDLVQSADREERQQTRTWCLTYDGIGWLETNGLTWTDRAKREVLEVYDRNKKGTLDG
jgi:hypothetical protein